MNKRGRHNLDQKAKPLTIFISRILKPTSPFYQFTQLGHDVVGQSFIKFDYLDFALPDGHPSYEAVFFYSPRAIPHFLKAQPYSEDIAYGVMGSGSQALYTDLTGRAPDIVGSGNKEQLIKDIKAKWSRKAILFPIAEDSLKSLEAGLEGIDFNYVTVYKNVVDTALRLPECDILAFTSPKNVQAYLAHHDIEGKEVVAIGATTAACIKSLTGLEVAYCVEPSEEALYKLVARRMGI